MNSINTSWLDVRAGDPDRVALHVVVPNGPTGSAELPGSLEIHAAGRCLTAREWLDPCCGSGKTSGILWDVLPLLRWFAGSALEHANEEYLPIPSAELKGADVFYTGAAWYADVVKNVLPAAEDDLWDRYDERLSAWTEHHGFGWADTGISLPPIFIRRLDDEVELSWETTKIPAADRRFRFTAEPGCETVPVESWLRVVDDCLSGVERRLREAGLDLSLSPAERIDPWRLLLPPSLRARDVLSSQLEDHLSLTTRTAVPRRWARHTWETRAIGALPPDSSVLDANRVLRWIDRHVTQSERPILASLREAKPAPRSDAWKQGYTYAKQIRRELSTATALQVGSGPVPSMTRLLRDLGVHVESESLHPAIRSAAAWRPDEAPRVCARTPDMSRPSFRLAVELGHLMMDASVDDTIVSLSSDYEDAARAARARAFAAMFLMPEEAVRAHPAAHANLSLDDLHELAETFRATPRTAALHLQNLQVISKRHRLDLEAALQSVAHGPDL